MVEGLKGKIDQVEPKDTYQIAYMIHFLLGAGYLIPWNSFVTAIDYFQQLYPNKHVDKAFSVGYTISSLLVLLLLMYGSSKRKLPGFRLRMNVGQSLFIIALMFAPVTDWIAHGDEEAPGEANTVAFVVLVLMAVVCGIADGLTAGSLVGATGQLPQRYMQAVFAGNASAGVLVCLARVTTKASLSQSPSGLKKSAQIYFLMSAFVEFLCIICCNLMDKLPVIQYHRQFRTVASKIPTSDLPITTTVQSNQPDFREVVKKIRWLVFAIFMIYVVTLSIFPGYLSEDVESMFFRDWYPILLIGMFNIGDFLGKSLTGLYVPKNSRGSIWGCMARLLFYPLFLGCINGPKWLKSEASVVLLTIMLGVSNGYLTSVLMIQAPKSVPVEESEIVGIVMTLFLVIGLAVGSVFGWLWNI